MNTEYIKAVKLKYMKKIISKENIFPIQTLQAIEERIQD